MKVGNYQFELKKFKFMEALSEETNYFSALLYVNGQQLAHCKNTGHGGSTDICFLPECRKLRQEIENFLKTQPKIKPEGFDFELNFNLEYIVDDLVQRILEAKELQRLMNKTKKYLVFKDNKRGYFTIGWKTETIDSMLRNPQYRIALKKTLATELAKGNILLNKNIPIELLPSKTESK